ncbi:Vigilin [Pteropus alecto]|uniref:Vigilin n=1 Tax=Pteropus alecto TaxID=9402 RepID=L5KT82_PTEAL|nr:Vigilin [Pteropus alecto]
MSSVAVLTQESFAEHRSGLVPQQIRVATLNSEEESDPPTYKDAFPPLPEKAPCSESTQEPAGAWGNKIRPIKASVITQQSYPFGFGVTIFLAFPPPLADVTLPPEPGVLAGSALLCEFMLGHVH